MDGDAHALEQALSSHGGTVTQFLEAVAGEPIDAEKLRRLGLPAGASDPLDVPAGRPLVQRAVVLRGRRTGRRFVYAESTIAEDRLPPSVLDELEHSAAPIGRVLTRHGLPVLRRASRRPDDAARCDAPGSEASGTVAEVRPRELGSAPLRRAYAILVAGRPAIAVEEWFLPPAVDALRPRRDPTPSVATDRASG